MSDTFHCGRVAGLFFVPVFFGICFCYGEAKEEAFDKVLSGYTSSVQRIECISLSYHLKQFEGGESRDERIGEIFFDHKNVKDKYTSMNFHGADDVLFETVVAPEWNRYIDVGRGKENLPTVFSCLEPENIPSVFPELGPMNLLFGRFVFNGEILYIPDVLRSLGVNNVKIADYGQKEKEIRFVYQGVQCRMLLDAETYTLSLFESKLPREEYVCKVVEFQNIDGVVFPKKFVVDVQMKVPLKDEVVERTSMHEYSFSDVLFTPLSEKDFQFTLPLPNGTPAVLKDARQIDHIWLDGKIVPKTDEAMLAIARGGHKFMPGPDEPRFWLMGIGIALILFACGKKTYDYFKNKK